jgi:hypothetical protein
LIDWLTSPARRLSGAGEGWECSKRRRPPRSSRAAFSTPRCRGNDWDRPN